jgi:hypothetical protein
VCAVDGTQANRAGEPGRDVGIYGVVATATVQPAKR